jgi:hypothetical protein
MLSFIEKLKQVQALAATPVDPWRLRLERVRGKVGDDGIERISTQRRIQGADSGILPRPVQLARW